MTNEIERKKQEITDNEPHTLCEMICINCKSRAYHVYHVETLLKDLECDKCKKTGYLIMTGQEID